MESARRGRLSPGVVRRPRALDQRHVRHGPIAQLLHHREQAATEVGQRVLDAWRNLVEDLAVHQPAPFQVAQCLGEHLAGDALDLAVHLAVPADARADRVQREDRPLVRDKVESLPRRAGLDQQVRRAELVIRHGRNLAAADR